MRKYPRGLPHSLQRWCCRVENFGFLTFCGFTLLSAQSLTLFAVVAMHLLRSYARNGIPSPRKSARAWSSFFALVTMVTFMPFSLSTLA